MPTYSVRCRVHACRYRRITHTHPDEYQIVPVCPKCGSHKGWRIENRDYNKRNLCNCSGPDMVRGVHFPHNTSHAFCDHNPNGFYNQAKQSGVADEDIPQQYRPNTQRSSDESCPF